MAEDIEAEYDEYLSSVGANVPVYTPRKLSYMGRWRAAKLIHIMIAVALFGCVLPFAILFFGIGALGVISAVMGR